MAQIGEAHFHCFLTICRKGKDCKIKGKTLPSGWRLCGPASHVWGPGTELEINELKEHIGRGRAKEGRGRMKEGRGERRSRTDPEEVGAGPEHGRRARVGKEAEPETNEDKGTRQRRGLEKVVTHRVGAVRRVAVTPLTAEPGFGKRGAHEQEKASVGHRRAELCYGSGRGRCIPPAPPRL